MAERAPIPGLPRQQEWKVLAVREGAEEPGQKGGTLKKFYVDFDGVEDVYWRRKMPATVEVGNSYFGTIDNGKFGPIFKKESPGGAGGGGGGSGGGRSFKPESQFDPEKTARIGRAHAQTCALRYAAGQDLRLADAGGLEDLLPIIDWFQADVDAAGEKAKATAPVAATEPQQSAPAPPDNSKERFSRLGHEAGLPQGAADALAEFITSKLNEEQLDRARTGLESEGSRAATLNQLEEAYRGSEGKGLPGIDNHDDIPF